MELKIYTKIIKKESDSVTNQLEIINEVLGNDISTNEFVTYNVKCLDYKLDSTRAATFTIVDIFSLLDIPVADCSFLHFQIRDTDLSTIDENDLYMTLKIGAEIFDCNQFTLTNIKNLTSDIQIVSVTIPTTKTGTLVIMGGQI